MIVKSNAIGSPNGYIIFAIIRWLIACLVVVNSISLKFKNMYLIIRLILGLVLEKLNTTIRVFKVLNKTSRSILNALEETIKLVLIL